MIKNYLFTLCFFSFLIANAQFKVINDKTGEELENGYEFHTTESGWTEGEIPWRFLYRVINTSGENIYLKLIADKFENNDTKKYVEFYFGGIELIEPRVGDQLPSKERAVEISADQNPHSSESMGCFRNVEENGDQMVTWTFRIQQYQDKAGTIEIGEPFYFSYIYNGHLSVPDEELKNIKVYPSFDKNIFKVETKERLTLSVYDLLGRVVKKESIGGHQSLDLSHMSSQPFILCFENVKGQKHIKKIVVE